MIIEQFNAEYAGGVRIYTTHRLQEHLQCVELVLLIALLDPTLLLSDITLFFLSIKVFKKKTEFYIFISVSAVTFARVSLLLRILHVT